MYIRRPHLLTILATASFFIYSSVYASTIQGDHLIIPGERVGPVYLGMSEDELIKISVPTKVDVYPLYDGSSVVPGIMYEYLTQMIDVFVARSNRRVVAIQIGYRGDCRGYHTIEGVGCSSNADHLIGAFGMWDPSLVSSYHGIRSVYYFNNNHSPKSKTKYSFVVEGASMGDEPKSQVQYIRLSEGDVN